ncbi:MAG: chromosomal replication initiator DnaA [Sphingopyxis sp.]
MSKQLPLPLLWGRGDTANEGEFYLGESNRLAALQLQRFQEWTSPATLLMGPAGCGKSLLARLFVAAGGGEAIDGLAHADEDAVFHAWNRAQADGHRLLIVVESRDHIEAVQLADLRTRLATAPVAIIGDPCTDISAALIEKLLDGRGLAHAPMLASYIAQRIERSYVAIHRVINAIDALAMASNRPVGTRLAREAMIGAGLFHALSNDSALEETV